MKKEAAHPLTPAGEDYLMKIYELSDRGRDPVRIRDLSQALAVSPSSASRMASAMCSRGLVNFRRYGYITLTERGEATGAYLRRRLAVAEEFFGDLCGDGPDTADEARRAAHFLSERTVAAMESRLRKKEIDN